MEKGAPKLFHEQQHQDGGACKENESDDAILMEVPLIRWFSMEIEVGR